MSRVSRVVVLCPNGRRQTVNLTPNSSILQILEEACQKQNINPDDFDLCHYNKPLDLSLPIRFANIPNNALLELQPAKSVRKDCYVTVALQLESGERIMKDFVPSTSVWTVIEQCLSTKPDLDGDEKKGEPVCIYMRQKLTGDAIKTTTLRGLGLTQGSAIIRLMYRNPDDLSDQAHVSSPLSKPLKDLTHVPTENKSFRTNSDTENVQPKEKPNISSNVHKTPENTNVSSVISEKRKPDQNIAFMTENTNNIKSFDEKFAKNLIGKNSNHSISALECAVVNNDTSKKGTSVLSADQKMEIDSITMDEDASQSEEIGPINYIGERHAVVYSLDDINDVKRADLPDEFFELTVEDARYLLEEFKKSRMEIENQPLLTKELRNRQMLQKLGRFKQAVIRIYFPERLVLQAVFEAQETVQNVIDFIRNYLEDQSLNFYLYTAPPKEKKDPSKTLIESMLIPASVMYFGCEGYNNSTYLKTSLREKISDPRAASLAASESRKQAVSEVEELVTESKDIEFNLTKAVVEENDVPGPSSEPSIRVQTTEKAPKWFKLSKK